MDGATLRDEGMALAIGNAGDAWAETAFGFMMDFIGKKEPFMVEDVRTHATSKGLPVPPSNRAWGSIVVKAKKAGMIKQVGYAQVKNPKAHKSNVAVWIGQ